MASNSANANANFTRSKLFDLQGRVALVTGGGSGIGLMCTQALVANGAKVYITGRTGEKLERVAEQYSADEGSIIPLTCDVGKKDQIAKLVAEISSREPCLCVLINNAGISSELVSPESSGAEEMKRNLFDTEKASFEEWQEVFNTNVAQLCKPPPTWPGPRVSPASQIRG